jgi:hypothetical protein
MREYAAPVDPEVVIQPETTMTYQVFYPPPLKNQVGKVTWSEKTGWEFYSTGRSTMLRNRSLKSLKAALDAYYSMQLRYEAVNRSFAPAESVTKYPVYDSPKTKTLLGEIYESDSRWVFEAAKMPFRIYNGSVDTVMLAVRSKFGSAACMCIMHDQPVPPDKVQHNKKKHKKKKHKEHKEQEGKRFLCQRSEHPHEELGYVDKHKGCWRFIPNDGTGPMEGQKLKKLVEMIVLNYGKVDIVGVTTTDKPLNDNEMRRMNIDIVEVEWEGFTSSDQETDDEQKINHEAAD